ncbi:MAG: aldo/keto reductase [Bryobacteraceae bacterium]|nr:aldo/keto reductase [Bryobacteraceae bacterium]MDW8378582.1 aldo/keto reductase [Bryobacterales bacterium]
MRYRKLGKTGLHVSVMGLGCAGFGGVYGDISEQQAIRAIHTAFDLGINFLDTAPLYGFTRSETVVGKALRGIPRDRYYLSSKVGRYSFQDSDFSYRRVKQGLEESLARLGCGYLDLAILHDIEFCPLDQVVEEGLRALIDARQEGKVRFVGASGLPLKIFPAILAVAELDVVISYAHYTLQNTSLLSLLPLFEQHNLGVINASPLGLGLLTPAGPPPWHLASEEIKAVCRKAAEWCASKGVDLAQLGMQFAYAQPGIHSTLSGAIQPEEVERNARAVDQPPDPDLVAAVQEILRPVKDRTWPSGRPEYN